MQFYTTLCLGPCPYPPFRFCMPQLTGHNSQLGNPLIFYAGPAASGQQRDRTKQAPALLELGALIFWGQARHMNNRIWDSSTGANISLLDRQKEREAERRIESCIRRGRREEQRRLLLAGCHCSLFQIIFIPAYHCFFMPRSPPLRRSHT